jgi:hypothetical protein
MEVVTSDHETPLNDDAQHPSKYLRLSHAMHPDHIVLQIRMALRDSAINCLSCKDLSMDLSHSYSSHLQQLLYSRNWQQLEFTRCVGMELLLEEDDSNGHCMNMEALLLATSHPRATLQTTTVDHLTLRMDSDCDIGTRFFSKLWKKWEIRTCDLSMFFSAERVRDFADISVPSNLRQMRFLNCQWPGLSNDNDDAPASSPPDHVSNEWKMFCQSLVHNHPALERIDFEFCRLSDAFFSFLIENALAMHTRLQQLEMDGCCGARSLFSMSRCLQNTQSQWSGHIPLWQRLTHLSITNADLSELVVLGLQEFCHALRNARHLRSLKLRNYMLHEPDMRALATSCTSMPNISQLFFTDCGLTAQSIDCLCMEALSQNRIPSLRWLEVPEDCKHQISCALISNTSLEHLSMHRNSAMNMYHLNLNRGGRRLLHHTLPISVWPEVLSRAMRQNYNGGEAHYFDALYFLLRNKILLEKD